ncbi:hypothetical protein C1H46_007338 [Malus baccata]|uniref:Uncharacterized protein n=1 Tax=Malus baccata TaxID=106549 RepID=A0A540N999_MALBA|nr:hypothetical protein C1H46_007338 [Malus baccata]
MIERAGIGFLYFHAVKASSFGSDSGRERERSRKKLRSFRASASSSSCSAHPLNESRRSAMVSGSPNKSPGGPSRELGRG